jgi:hypothetical protein
MKFVHGFAVDVVTKTEFRNCLPLYQEAAASLTMPLLSNYLISGFKASVGALGVHPRVQSTCSQPASVIHWDPRRYIKHSRGNSFRITFSIYCPG